MGFGAVTVIHRALPTLNNVAYSWEGEDTVRVKYALGKPSSTEFVELMFAKRYPEFRWALYACSENFHPTLWTGVQAKLRELQDKEERLGADGE